MYDITSVGLPLELSYQVLKSLPSLTIIAKTWSSRGMIVCGIGERMGD